MCTNPVCASFFSFIISNDLLTVDHYFIVCLLKLSSGKEATINKKRKKVGTKLFVGTTEHTFGMFLSFFPATVQNCFFLFLRRFFIQCVKMFGCGLEMISSPLHETPTTFIDFDHFSPLRRFLIQYKNVWTQWTHLCIELFILPKEIDTQLSQSDIDFLVEYYDFIVEYLI